MSGNDRNYNASQCLKIGTVLNGKTKYTIKGILGQGGFGITYLVHTPEGEPRAIKEYYPRDYCDRVGNTVECRSHQNVVEEFKDKFKKEVERIQLATHKNVIKTYDLFEANKTIYYVMEYAPGESLEVFTDEVPEKQAVSYINDIAEAVAVLHQRRVNHLDIKPENIVLRQNGEPVLIDFGIARGFDKSGKVQTSINNFNSSSQGYAPYEQYGGNGITEFSAQADIYALGATLYRLLTGNKPCAPEKYVLNEATLTFPPTVSKHVQDAVRYAMQYSKDKRPKNIAEFLAVLNNICPAPPHVTGSSAATLPADDGGTRIEGIGSPVNTTAPSQPSQPAPTVNPKPINKPVPPKDNTIRNLLIGAAIVVVGIVGYKFMGSSNPQDAPKVETTQPMASTADQSAPATQPNTQAATTTKNTQPSQTNKTNTKPSTSTTRSAAVAQPPAKSAAKETTPTKTETPVATTTPTRTPAASSTASSTVTTPAPAPAAESSASELLAKGISASKKFNYENAASYFTQAANKGNVTAMYLLGDLYYNGNGVDKSYPTARKYFTQAANAGYMEAQYMLGMMYRKGHGGTKDINQAKIWLQKAAAQGHVQAERTLDKL